MSLLELDMSNVDREELEHTHNARSAAAVICLTGTSWFHNNSRATPYSGYHSFKSFHKAQRRPTFG
jgi:hypothetical protein